MDEIREFAGRLRETSLGGYADKLIARANQLQDLTQSLLRDAKISPNALWAAACDYLHIVGYLSYGYMWLRMMATDGAGESKQKTGAYYFSRVLPRIDSLVAAVESGPDAMMALSDEEF